VGTSSLPYSANKPSPGGSTLDSALVGETDAATLAWLVGALEHARARGQTTLVGCLEAVADEVVFEVEFAARRNTCI